MRTRAYSLERWMWSSCTVGSLLDVLLLQEVAFRIVVETLLWMVSFEGGIRPRSWPGRYVFFIWNLFPVVFQDFVASTCQDRVIFHLCILCKVSFSYSMNWMAVLLPKLNSGELRNIVRLMTSQALSFALRGVHWLVLLVWATVLL